MLKATPENFRVTIHRLIDPKSSAFNFEAVIKTYFMIADVRLVSTNPDLEMLSDGEITIFDMDKYSIWHLMKTSLSTMKLYFKYTQEAFPVRIKQVHIVNCTPLINNIMKLAKPFLSEAVAKHLQFHPPGSEALFDFVPRDVLPYEFGGTYGPMSDIKTYWMNKFSERRLVSCSCRLSSKQV
jgi:CRAL/TRIO domain